MNHRGHRGAQGLRGVIACAVVVLVASVAAFAADLAILRNGFSIRHERREVMGEVTRLYLNNDGSGYVDVRNEEVDHFERDLTPAQGTTALKLPDVVGSASHRYHLDPDLVNSVIRAESGFNPKAVSRKGAVGLMQLEPQTAAQLGVTDIFDPSANVDGGTRYLRELLVRYNFDLIKALAAYNAGPQRVEQYHGVPPYYETQAYVAQVVRDFNRKKLAERKAAEVKKTSAHKTTPVKPATESQ
ncbi:MAG: lytic transglycosylase domain-containing protein [Terriglobales bacterium]|jgi:transglycosylase-like protein with SLT domain